MTSTGAELTDPWLREVVTGLSRTVRWAASEVLDAIEPERYYWTKEMLEKAYNDGRLRKYHPGEGFQRALGILKYDYGERLGLIGFFSQGTTEHDRVVLSTIAKFDLKLYEALKMGLRNRKKSRKTHQVRLELSDGSVTTPVRTLSDLVLSIRSIAYRDLEDRGMLWISEVEEISKAIQDLYASRRKNMARATHAGLPSDQ